MFETLRTEVSGPVGRLTLQRPKRLNALSRSLLGELIEAARWFDARRDAKVVVVEGAGRAFCAGFDLDDFLQPDPELPPREVAELGRLMAEAIAGMRALTIAAIQGRCVGGGLVLAAACDLRLAADDAVFSIPEVDLGIPLAWGGIPRLVREIGPAMTKELVLTCRPFDAQEARELHFLNRVVAAERLADEAASLAAELASKSSLALTVTKRHVNAVSEAIASTAGAAMDADVLVSALSDPESRDAAQHYLAARGRADR
ncbi:MAG TPA: enoyl-CoA hydratase/isomerase family protein [Solirubrobacteraceae bacterium]|nr:enoyl-CoA hydratase/isomerase family protein [Solirubrobacteraceae bacterium]